MFPSTLSLFRATTLDVEVGRTHNEPSHRGDLQKITDQILLNRFVPPSVLVNDRLEVIQFIGQTGPYFDPTPGDATLNLLKLVKGGLQFELRLAFQRLKRTGTVRREGVLIQLNGHINTANFEIIPVKNMPGKERYYLVVFEEGKPFHKPSSPKGAAKPLVEKKPAKSLRGRSRKYASERRTECHARISAIHY